MARYASLETLYNRAIKRQKDVFKTEKHFSVTVDIMRFYCDALNEDIISVGLAIHSHDPNLSNEDKKILFYESMLDSFEPKKNNEIFNKFEATINSLLN